MNWRTEQKGMRFMPAQHLLLGKFGQELDGCMSLKEDIIFTFCLYYTFLKDIFKNRFCT